MMQKKIVTIVCFILFVSFLDSCGSMGKFSNTFSKKEPVANATLRKSSLLSSRWRLDYITGPRIAFEGLYPGKKPFMVLDSAKFQVSGNTGCNNFSGPFKASGDIIQFNQLTTTMANCTDGGQGEALFLGILGKVSHYRVSGDTLWLKYKKIDAMRFVRDTSTTK